MFVGCYISLLNAVRRDEVSEGKTRMTVMIDACVFMCIHI